MAAARGSLPTTSSGTGSPGSQPDSPPQYQMDQLSIAEHMNANKQVLNRKLMVRRSVPELVDAGIYPPSPYAFAGQRILLERAKTGDILKHKIERRPARDFLVQHHILDDSNVDPSLQSMQRKLKKAKLTDELNEKLEHRPGPLELVTQRILEVDDPIKTALEEGKLQFQKAEDAVETSSVVKQPYVVESPKSGQSSPDPLDFDDSNSITSTCTSFNASQVPSPPDISPLLNKPTTLSRTIGGQTISIPLTSQPSQPFRPPGQFVLPSPQQPYPTSSRSQQQGAISSRPNRRNSRHSRSKQQTKQRVIKFHEYKGPPTSKASNSVGTFVTTTGPMQRLDGLTAHEMRVHQQNLYLQCQMEVESKANTPTLLHSVKASPATPLSQSQVSDIHEMQEPPTPNPDLARSRPETPSFSIRSPPTTISSNSHSVLHVSRSLSHLEDLKVADLKQELKRRDLTVSGSKPQLIERLREHQLRELSASIPSVSTASPAPSSELSYSAATPSVQSFSDEVIMAPPSVASITSVSGSVLPPNISSPPQTPSSPMEDLLKSPSINPGMETDESTSQSSKTTADMHKTVRAQAKQIEVLTRQLMQFQQQYPMVHQPLATTPTPAPQQTVSSQQEQVPSVTQLQQVPSAVLPQMQELLQQSSQQQGQEFSQHMQQQATPINIPDKQVYLATPDGKMTAYKVILHTGNGVLQQMIPKLATPDQIAPTTLVTSSQISGEQTISLPNFADMDGKGLSSSALHENDEQSINVGDVIDVLIQTGEMDPEAVSNEEQKGGEQVGEERMDGNQTRQLNSETIDLELPLSPLDMDWIDTNSNSHYPDGFSSHNVPTTESFSYSGHNELDWLSNMHLDMDQPKINSLDDINSSSRSLSTSDPVLSPKPPDLMNIFNLDDSDFRVATDSGSDYNWDKLISQTSHNL